MVINQIHAIGDLLFLEPMYRHFFRLKGKKPVVPVRDHLFWISEYIDSAIFVKMSQFNMDYEDRDVRNDYLPLRWANHIIREVADDDYTFHEFGMPDKYTMAALDPSMWALLNINFIEKRGIDLMNKLNLSPKDDYILINNHSQAGSIDIKVNADKIIYMQNIPGFTVLDWYLVMLHAKENHHVSTSTFYVLQAIKNKFGLENPVYMYPRPNFDGLRGISKLDPTYNLIRCE